MHTTYPILRPGRRETRERTAAGKIMARATARTGHHDRRRELTTRITGGAKTLDDTQWDLPGVSSEEFAELRKLRAEVRELRRTRSRSSSGPPSASAARPEPSGTPTATRWPSPWSACFETELIKPRGHSHSAEQVEPATLEEYVDWFNHQWPHEACSDTPPAELKAAYYSQSDCRPRRGRSLNKLSLRTHRGDSVST